MSSASLKDHSKAKGGVFNVKVYNGGNAICGPGATATISRKYHKSSCSAHRHNKAISYPLGDDYNKSELLQGPEQRLTDVPAKVYQELEKQLSFGQSDWKNLACHIFPSLKQDEIEYLTTRYRRNRAEGIFKKMSERGITLGQLVKGLESIERQDALEILFEAGYPRESDTIAENDESVMEACSRIQEEAIDEEREEVPQENVCFEKNSYRVFIEEPTLKGVIGSADGSSTSFVRNLMSRVCLVQFPTTPEERFTSAVSMFEEIQRE
ncbi:uncharacterized protein LOC116300492 [Actinia tenebrosa]|uniref:Uncharacterized protein LOC116300492 n=1 Tax=Actinia tenebrosa TaxID=6105 RepID=A0A6P8IAN6_ACTTE|nr:uncharacterized protein LOC116300492 [Actinia tenebrosa]